MAVTAATFSAWAVPQTGQLLRGLLCEEQQGRLLQANRHWHGTGSAPNSSEA